MRILAATIFAIVFPALAHAQFLENVQGPFLSGSPPTGFSGQNFQYNCTNATPTVGTCTPVVIIGNANPNGQASLNNGQPVSMAAVQVTADLCTLQRKINVPISTTAAVTQLVAPVSLNQVYICSIFIQPTANDTVSIIGGLGSTCATGTPLAMAGSTTAASGMDVLASQGFAPGNGGGTLMSTTTAGHGVCLTHTGSTKLAGFMTYVQSLL